MEKIVLFSNKSECCGCSACFNICPKNAIYMDTDEYGFIYPIIDNKLCIGCKLCKKSCYFQKLRDIPKSNETWVAVNKDDKTLDNSSSGGVFTTAAKYILKKGGTVFGCSMETDNETFVPKHIAIRNSDDLSKLQGSKYVQSNIGYIYQTIKEELEQNKYVLFTGTPCQASGLRGFLHNKDYDKLLIIDIICHGVPSAKFFKDYLEFLSTKMNVLITKFNFRDKTKGWGIYAKLNYIKRDKNYSKIVSAQESSYYKLFLDGKTYRESCYACPYASTMRTGDLTIGDYWGIEREHPSYLERNGGTIKSSKGVSCIIVNSDIGKKYLNDMLSDLILLPSSFNSVSKENEQLRKPVKKSDQREEILELYKSGGYKLVNGWYIREYYNEIARSKIRKIASATFSYLKKILQ